MPTRDTISELFPGRHTLTIGDSVQTLPVAEAFLKGACDLVFVDGGHSGAEALADIKNFRALAKPGARILIDDCQAIPEVEKAWEEAKAFEDFEELRRVCIGRYALEADAGRAAHGTL